MTEPVWLRALTESLQSAHEQTLASIDMGGRFYRQVDCPQNVRSRYSEEPRMET